jgi:hypothetical protein
MKVSVKKIYNDRGEETGAVLSSGFDIKIDAVKKERIESQLILYAFNVLYKQETLIIYHERHLDTASVIVLRKVNDLDESVVSIDVPL